MSCLMPSVVLSSLCSPKSRKCFPPRLHSLSSSVTPRQDKFEDEPFMRHHKLGLLSMANKGANTNNSQFFITLKVRRRSRGSPVPRLCSFAGCTPKYRTST